MTQQTGLPELPEPLTCVDSGNRPWCLAGQRLPSFGKGGPPGKLSPHFCRLLPRFPILLYSTPEVPSPGSQCPLVDVTLSQAPAAFCVGLRWSLFWSSGGFIGFNWRVRVRFAASYQGGGVLCFRLPPSPDELRSLEDALFFFFFF